MGLIRLSVAYAKESLKSLKPPKRGKAKTSVATLLPDIDSYKQDNNSQLIFRPEEQGVRRNQSQRAWSQVLSLLPVYLLQLCYGMNSGFPAILTPQLAEPCSEFQISLDQESWIVSLDNLLSPLICITSGFLQQKVGPLKILMFSCIPYTIGWLAAALATCANHLYVSRIFVSVSHAFICTTVYTIEISSKELRGSFSVLESVVRCTGTVLMYILGLYFRWWEIASLASLVPILAFFSCMFVPESPVFLVKKGRIDEAEVNISRTFGPKFDSKQEVEIISDNLENLRNSTSRKSDYIKNIRKHPEIYKPFFIIVFLSLVQQFSGMSVIRAYVVKIFDEVFSEFNHRSINAFNSSTLVTECSIESKTSQMAYISAMLIGLCRLVSSLALSRLLRNYHRRFMYSISLIFTIIFLIAFSSLSYIITNPDSLSSTNLSIMRWASLATACLLVFSVQLGVQTLPLLLSGELFPADVRASCKGLTRAITCIFLVLSVKLFPLLESYFSLYGTFFMFSFFIIIFTPVIYFILPETKDLSLEMIQQYFTPQETVWYTNLGVLQES